MPEAGLTPRRVRGNYSKVICLRCRKRKIRCILPENDLVEPSDVPQPPDRACQRCRQHGLDCIIDRTVLGRPSQKRSLKDDRGDSLEYTASPTEHQQLDENTQLPDSSQSNTSDVEPFLQTHPREDKSQKLDKTDLYESLLSPLHLLSALLARDKQFASTIHAPPNPRLSLDTIIEIITADVCSVLDGRLVWHQVFFPYIPTLITLRIALLEERSCSRLISTRLLFVLLVSLAIDIPPGLSHLRRCQPALATLIRSYGQVMMFDLPKNRYTIIAFELISIYRPTALVSDPIAASHAVRSEFHVTLAKRVALQLRMNVAIRRVDDSLDNPDSLVTEGDIMDSLQWCGLLRAELELDWHGQPVEGRTFRSDPALASNWLERSVVVLEKALNTGRIPPKCWYLTNRHLAFSAKNRAVQELKCSWRDFEALGKIIDSHQATCDIAAESADRMLPQLFPDDEQRQYALGQLSNMARQCHHLQVAGHGMFYALMSTAHPATSESVELEQAARAGEFIIEKLKAHAESDPFRSPIRIFLERYGQSRVDSLESCLSNWITLVDDVPLDGVPYYAPTRNQCTDILFTCKDLVEQNAARLKGWGGLHERVETQLILFQECARRLEAMEVGTSPKDAISKGSLSVSTAKMIRALHRIVSGWKRSIVQNKRRRPHKEENVITPTPQAEPLSQAIPTTCTSDHNAGDLGTETGLLDMSLDELLNDDVLADWSNWPSFDAHDADGFFTEGEQL